ncbi:MAG: HAD family hydrolase [Candidatus Saccharimonadales bacterium]
MATKFKAILFDLDGTLRDTIDVIYDALEHAIEFHTGKRPGREVIAPHIHHHTAVHAALLPEVSLRDWEKTYYEKVEQKRDEWMLFHQTIEVLESLHAKGYALAIVTSARQDTSEEFLKQKGIHSFFASISGMREGVKPKPAPDLVLRALDEIGCEPAEALMVGDMTVDVTAAHAAGVQCVGITHGFGSREELEAAGADFIIDSLGELENYLDS